MGAFGERLRKTRENKKITLDDVSVATKISTRMLRALEEEKFKELPGGVFNKGFVRAYARHLGLDEEKTILEYVAASGGAPLPVPEDVELKAIAERKDKERQHKESEGLPWGVVAVVLLVVALGLSVWGFYSREGKPVPRKPAVAKQEAVTPAPAAAPAATENLPAAGTTAPASQVANVAPLPATASDTTAPTMQDAAFGPTFTVLIKANDDSWISISADGKVLFQDTLLASGEKSVSAQKQISVRAGNVAGLDIFFNGKKVAVDGGDNEARTLTFGPDGLQPASSAAR